jgi:signal transduction histidine kinase
VNEIHSAGKYLLGHVNELLDLAEIESGKIKLHPGPVDVMSLIHESISIVKPLANVRHIELSVENNVKHTTVIADTKRLKEVFINLLSNAVKYNRDVGQVRIILDAEDKAIRISIKDTGPGLTDEEKNAIFEPFYRLAGRNSTTEGTGIGLPICRRLVELMHGTIEVSSTPGQGSCFCVVLPTS